MNLGEIIGLLDEAGISLSAETMRLFINAGQKQLDRMSDFPHGQAEIPFNLNAGDYFLLFPTRVRIVHGCWLKETAADVGVALDKKDYVVLKALYPNQSEPSLFGTPTMFAHTSSIIASLGSPLPDELAMPADDVQMAANDPHDYKGLIIAPTPNQAFILKTLVTAYSVALVGDGDESFWTKHHPIALFNATMFKIEGFLRNASSAGDYLKAAQAEISEINFDAYEDEMQGRPNYMGQ